MRIHLKYGLLTALIAMLPGMMFAQVRQSMDPNAPPSGDPRSPAALAILTQSLAAMTPPGSAVTGVSITTLEASGTFDKRNTSGAWVSGTFHYVDDLNSQQPKYKRSIEFQGIKQRYWSNHGDPSSWNDASAGGKTQAASAAQSGITKMRNRKFEAQYLPYVLLYQASTLSEISVYQLGTISIQGKSYVHIETFHSGQTKNGRPTRRDWYIDAQTMLPYVAMELVYGMSGHSSFERTTYTAYQPQDELLWPMEQSIAYDGAEFARLHLSSVQTNVKVDPSMFDAVAGN